MNEQLKALYQKVLLTRQKSQQGYSKRPAAEVALEAYNPICGDQFTLYFDWSDDRLTQVSFHGYGCAISKASTSLLVEELEGCTLIEAQEVLNTFFAQMESSQADNPDDLRKALAVSKDFPGRAQCALLSWESFDDYLKTFQNHQTNS